MRYACALLILCGVAFAQDVPRAEVFLGGSYLNADTNGATARLNAAGGNISFVANVSPELGLETNFSYYYKSLNFMGLFGSNKLNLNDYNLVFGPRLHFKWAYAHVLVGIDTVNRISSVGAVAGAGGIYKINRHVGVEAGADYYFTHYTFPQHDVRAVAGVVFTFGSAGVVTEQVLEPGPTSRPAPAQRATSAGMKIAALGIMAQVGRNGAEITDVAPNGVAALAGMHPGDVIDAVDGKPIKTPMELAAELSARTPGDKVRIGYALHGQWQTETIIVLP